MVTNMTFKLIKIISVVFAFLISFVFHFVYELLPINLLALFFPVNESIFEHMKIIFYAMIISSLLELILYKKYKIKINNFNISVMLKSVVGVVFYLVIYIPIYLILKENLFISIILLLITYIFMEYLSVRVLVSSDENIKVLPVIIIFLVAILFVILTFYPLHNFLFFDNISYGYGILK